MEIYMIVAAFEDGDDYTQNDVMYVNTIPPTSDDWLKAAVNRFDMALVTVEDGKVVSSVMHTIIDKSRLDTDHEARFSLARLATAPKATFIMTLPHPDHVIAEDDRIVITSKTIEREVEIYSDDYPQLPTIRIFMSGHECSLYIDGKWVSSQDVGATLEAIVTEKSLQGYRLVARTMHPEQTDVSVSDLLVLLKRFGSAHAYLITDQSADWESAARSRTISYGWRIASEKDGQLANWEVLPHIEQA